LVSWFKGGTGGVVISGVPSDPAVALCDSSNG
jgi:hypothetical protein